MTDLETCLFYQSIDLPGLGSFQGQWDLRPGIDRYLSDVPYAGATVLDIGAASGFVTFELERRGAEVIALDQAEGAGFDTIPFHDLNPAIPQHQTAWLESVKNAFWLSHRILGSRARAVYASANDIPAAIGPVDVAFIGNVLQHLRDPLGAIASAAAVARRVVVTEAVWRTDFDPEEPLLYFLSALRDDEPSGPKSMGWWQVSLGMVTRWLEVVGMRIEQRYDHEQLFVEGGARIPHYTVVATWP
ncbi:MAG TPA: class I SAM-dependent methyltransferase [Thermoleophilaceae bacterium]|nr:class I SAM-dependent methyltransferase [Thermoleophilaceae bacterium]